MGNIFSSKHKKGREITEEDRAVLSLKTQRRKLTAERTRVEGIIDRELQIARQLIAQKKRDRALLFLKRKKIQEQQVERLDAWLINVEQLLANIETAKRQNRLFDALKQGQVALKELQQEVKIEDVERLMDDTAEAKAYQDEVAQLMGQTLTPEQDQAALAELESLEDATIQQEVDEQLPSVPQHTLEPKQPATAAESPAEGAPAASREPSQQLADASRAKKEPLRAEEPVAA
ncbi:hypothetical protein WJX74_006989 [Apatococcus lobatus]|uniref:Charged multivesicular body protein 6 n=1 Tax=Apatococcus lobatus TaxID=904363 RepID=A0AAW1Q9T9_9CHLO